MTPAELKEGAKLARSHKHFKQRSTAPSSLTDVMPATPQYMPEDKSERAVFNGFPAEHQSRTVLISPRPDKTMQSGQGHVHQWQITWKQPRRIANTNKLYGEYAVRVQRMARKFVHGRLRLWNQKSEMRAQYEFNMSAGSGLVKALSSLQVQIINETIHNPMGKKWRSLHGQDCEAWGPVQALYVGALGGKGNFDRTALLTNRMDVQALAKWWLRVQDTDELEEMIVYEKKKVRKTGGRYDKNKGKDGKLDSETEVGEGDQEVLGLGLEEDDVSVAGSVTSKASKNGGKKETAAARKMRIATEEAKAMAVAEENKTPQQVEDDAKRARDIEAAAEDTAKVRAAKDKEKRKKLAKWRVDPPPYNSLIEALKVNLASLPKRNDWLNQTDIDIVMDHNANPRTLALGDVIQLKNASKVPADCRIVKILDEGVEGDFQINEKSLTGESIPVTKHIDVINNEESGFSELNFAAANMAYMGTSVAQGNALAVVTAVGKYTFAGTVCSTLH
jgi:hypothetical protein